MTTAAPGRAAQRRRTRRAIVEATMALLGEGAEPSVNDIAARADVSRRTIYLHFPTLDQLVLDATAGLMTEDVDAALARVDSEDPRERVRVLVGEVYRSMERSLPLGRKLIKLTVDAPPPAADLPRRGYRRIGWLEWVLEPARSRLTSQQGDDLVSSLALVIGWEAFIVLLDVRGLSPDAARELTLRTALVLLDAALPAEQD
ncbi:TetR/AcrR family transcriptional regulator [Jatrophihabitans sp.]|jgi:AcrR family transcriptional regulator|uniref:TetR/AcrR family transcriptional regulator n=1 Tax=Jatrophihabitans sp. TaxID=1932789 RepID=UPI002F220C6C